MKRKWMMMMRMKVWRKKMKRRKVVQKKGEAMIHVKKGRGFSEKGNTESC